MPCLDYNSNLFSGLDKCSLALLIIRMLLQILVFFIFFYFFIFQGHCFDHHAAPLYCSTSTPFSISSEGCLSSPLKPFTAPSHLNHPSFVIRKPAPASYHFSVIRAFGPYLFFIPYVYYKSTLVLSPLLFFTLGRSPP